MQKWLTILLGLLVAVLVYEVLRRQLLKRTALKIRLKGQRITDTAMEAVLVTLKSEAVAQQVSGQLHSIPVAAVWGRGVMAFEYVLTTPGMTTADLHEVRKLLNNHLQKYAQAEQLPAWQDAGPALRVTDTWLRDGQLHLDVAYLMNEATFEYLEDLRRLNSNH